MNLVITTIIASSISIVSLFLTSNVLALGTLDIDEKLTLSMFNGSDFAKDVI